jgi:uncharacterized protein YuzE
LFSIYFFEENVFIKAKDTVEVEANILIDYGLHGEIMGIEIIDASTLTKANPLDEIVIKIRIGPRFEFS